MKKLSLMIAVFGLATSAFAQTYQCELLRDSEGHGIYGGPGYAVELNGDEVNLSVTQGTTAGPHAHYFVRMEKIQQETEGAVYQANDVTAYINLGPVNGHMGTLVSIKKDIGGKEYTASCYSN